jgi:predicted metal-dependent hydrolase
MNTGIIPSPISYEMKRTRRTRRLRITIHRDARVVVSAPLLMPSFLINRFVESKKEWITSKVEEFKKNPPGPAPLMTTGGRREFKAHKKQALELVRVRLAYFTGGSQAPYPFPYKKVVIRNQKTR